MLEAERVTYLFAGARELYEDALGMLEQGRLRNAADKAWGAIKPATDPLILARTGEEPRTSGRTVRTLRQLRGQDPTLEPLRLHYGARQYFLHGRCFYDGILEPEDDIVRDVRETIAFIQDAELAAGR